MFDSIFLHLFRNSTVQFKIIMASKLTGKGTKVQQLSDYIQETIALNNLKSGDSLPSINQLTKKFGVSRDTVFKSFLDLKSRGAIDSIHGKSYIVASHTKNILLVLDEYSSFKELLYNTLISKLPPSYNVDLWFHQYNEHLFHKIIGESIGKYNKYLVMNYDNEKFSDSLLKIDKKKLLLLDFGGFDKAGYSYVCQNFEDFLYDSLSAIKKDLLKYKKMIYVLSREHKHPQSSKLAFSQFCLDHNFEFEILDEITDKTVIMKDYFYLVVKQSDVVNIIKQSRNQKLKMRHDFGLLAYNENPFYEIVDEGISSIGIDWSEMGRIASEFVCLDQAVQTYLPTVITSRGSF